VWTEIGYTGLSIRWCKNNGFLWLEGEVVGVDKTLILETERNPTRRGDQKWTKRKNRRGPLLAEGEGRIHE